MVKIKGSYRGILFFFCLISVLNGILFWQVFLHNKIPFSANLLVSLFSPWKLEKFPQWEVGIPNKPTGKDDLWIFYPQRTFTTSVEKHGEIPFWNPYSFSGNYHVGLSETAVFYPFNILFLLFPQIHAWVALIIIQPIIAGIGMYLFLKRLVIYEKSAILGGLAFAFSGVVITRAVDGLSVGHTLIWLPYAFWGISSFFQTKKIRFLWVMLIVFVLSLLAGWFQFTFYILVFSFTFAVFSFYGETKQRGWRNYLIFLPFLILPCVTLFHTIPAFQAFIDSPRSALEGRLFSFQHLMPLIHIVTLIFPDFWGNPAVYNFYGKSDYKEYMLFTGVIPLFFSLLVIDKKKTRNELFFMIAIIVALLLGIDNFFSKWVVSLSLPIYSSFIPNRIFIIAIFSFCVLSAFGFDFLQTEKKELAWKKLKKILFCFWIVVFLFIGWIGYQILPDPGVLLRVNNFGLNTNVLSIQFRSTFISFIILLLVTGVCILLRNKYTKNIFFIAIIVIVFLQSFLFGQKYIPFSERQFVYPEHPVFDYLKKHQGIDRFMSIGNGHIVPSMPLEFGLFSPEGIGSMYIRRYGELVRYMQHGDFGISNKIAFDLEIDPKDVFINPNSRLYRFFSLVNVKHIVVDKKSMKDNQLTPEIKDFSLAWENDKWQIYEYKRSMPRFFVTSDFIINNNKEKILQTLFDENFAKTKIILEEDPGFIPNNNIGTVRVITYSANTIIMEVETEKDALAYLSDTYSKVFKVFIDGEEGKILRANFAFRAIPIEKGKHTIVVRYDTTNAYLGFIISVFVLSSLGVLSVFFSKVDR